MRTRALLVTTAVVLVAGAKGLPYLRVLREITREQAGQVKGGMALEEVEKLLRGPGVGQDDIPEGIILESPPRIRLGGSLGVGFPFVRLWFGRDFALAVEFRSSGKACFIAEHQIARTSFPTRAGTALRRSMNLVP